MFELVLTIFAATTQLQHGSWRYPEGALDWAFMEAQEAWVVEQVHPLYRAEFAWSLVPDELRHSVRRLGANYYKVRDKAKAELIVRGPAIAPVLVRAQYLGDPEITLRCRNILRVLSACPGCDGRGYSRDNDVVMACRWCQTLGRLWPLEDFNGGMPDP